MTQELINKYFQGELGQQCNELFSTQDDRVFIRYEEAWEHSLREAFPFTSIVTWHDTNDDVYTDEREYDEDDTVGEREFMKSEGENRQLTEDERIIYNL